MRLYVCLIHDVNTILITEFIERRIVRIMRSTDGIDVQLFHQLNVFSHILFRQIPSILRIVLMTVHTGDCNDLAVYTKSCIVCICIGDLHFTESDIGLCRFFCHTVFFQFQNQVVKVRFLCTPFFRIGDVLCQTYFCFFCLAVKGSNCSGERCGCHQLAFAVVEVSFYTPSAHILCGKIAYIHIDIQVCICVSVIQIGNYRIITDFHVIFGCQVDITEDTGKSYHILVLDVASVGPAVNLYGNHVLVSF